MALSPRQLIKIASCTISVSPLFANKWLCDETVLRLLLARYPISRPSWPPPDGAGGAAGGGRGQRRGGRMQDEQALLAAEEGWVAGGGPRKESPARTEETTSDTSSTDGSGGLDQQVTLVVPKTARTSITSGPAPPARAPGAVRWREYANQSTGRRYYSDGTSTKWTPPPELAADPGRVPARDRDRPRPQGAARRRGRRCGASERRQGGRWR